MGFEAPRIIVKLDFAGTDLEGLEVRMRSQSVGELSQATSRMAAMAVVAKRMLDMDASDEESAKKAFADIDADSVSGVREVFQDFAAHLVSWNLQEDGVPVPATLEGVNTQDSTFILRLSRAWQEALSGVGNPLPSGSSSGRPPDLSSIPTEALVSLPS